MKAIFSKGWGSILVVVEPVKRTVFPDTLILFPFSDKESARATMCYINGLSQTDERYDAFQELSAKINKHWQEVEGVEGDDE